MRLVALASSLLLFLVFALVAVLAYKEGDSQGMRVSGGVMLAMAAFFAYEIFELQRSKIQNK